MNASDPTKTERGCGFWLFLGFAGLAILVLFWNEARLAWSFISYLGRPLLGMKSGPMPPLDDLASVFGFLIVNLFTALVFVFILQFLLSQAIFPAYTGEQRWHVFERLLMFLFGSRAPVLFVRDGKLVKDIPEKTGEHSGLLIVDLNSAAILEKQLPVVPLMASDGKQGHTYPGRVCKPGLSAIGWNERLRGVVHLRKQFRILLNNKAYTSDGIEVEGGAFALFSLSQPATIIKVIYQGDFLAENLRVVQIDEEAKKIKSIADELDAIDRAEIHQFAQAFINGGEASVQLEPAESSREVPPYPIDEERILAAIYSQGRNVNDSKLDNWADLPAQVAVETWRSLLSQIKYDDIYLPKDPVRFPLQQEIKPRFARAVKSQGIMSYQFIHRLDGMPIAVGQRVDGRQFRVSPVQKLRSSKVLRDRGIKVIHAGFTELKPDPAIRQQRLDNWRANLDRNISRTLAKQEEDRVETIHEALAETQEKMSKSLSSILQGQDYSEEALALRVFQALEDMTSDPAARRVMPRDVINILRNLLTWLMPGDRAASIPSRDIIDDESEAQDE